MAAPFRTEMIPIHDGELHVGRWGDGPALVVAVHGLTLTHAQFHALGDQLGDDITLVAPDLRGRGGSAHLGPPYGMAAHADDVAALLDQLDADETTVLGYSAGASVAG
ncbi:MAG TPA: alpha/beta fold hydrolase, partial [Acidimicrobiales bacterium]